MEPDITLRDSWLEMDALTGNMTLPQLIWRWHIIILSIQVKFGKEFKLIIAFKNTMIMNGKRVKSVNFALDSKMNLRPLLIK